MPKNQNELGRCSGSQKQPWLITLLGSAALLGACDGVPSEVEQNAGEVITGEEALHHREGRWRHQLQG